jgi:hypothetical protein
VIFGGVVSKPIANRCIPWYRIRLICRCGHFALETVDESIACGNGRRVFFECFYTSTVSLWFSYVPTIQPVQVSNNRIAWRARISVDTADDDVSVQFQPHRS